MGNENNFIVELCIIIWMFLQSMSERKANSLFIGFSEQRKDMIGFNFSWLCTRPRFETTLVPEVFFRRKETRQERERSGERKLLVAGDATLTIMLP